MEWENIIKNKMLLSIIILIIVSRNIKKFDTSITPHYCCEIAERDINVVVDNQLEKFYCLMIWVPYKCGYGCNTNICHTHGN